MRQSLLNLGLLGAVTAALFIPAKANADDSHPFTLRVDPGVAFPLTQPQTDHFKVGGDLELKPTLALTSWFDANVTLGIMALPSRIENVDTGLDLGLGLGARVKRPHDVSNTGTGLSAVSPWADTDVQLVRTGPLNRAALELAVGASVPTDASRTLWVGPFARYQDIVELQHPGFNSADAHVLILGLDFEFGAPVQKPVQKVVVNETVVIPDVPVTPPPAPVPTPVVVAPVAIELHEKIQFPYDSAKPLPESLAALKRVVSFFFSHPGNAVEVDGYASAEGNADYNVALSTRRAQAVADFLVKNGVPVEHLTVKGFGATNFIAPNDTEANRSKNRRVEFSVDITITQPAGDSK